MPLLITILLCLSLFGCAEKAITSPDITPRTLADFTHQPDGIRFQVDKVTSEIRMISYPEGRFGHAHVVGGHIINGEIVLPEDHHQVWLKLEIDVEAMVVDQQSWREDERMKSHPGQQAVHGTRENLMSQAVLDVKNHPLIIIRVDNVIGPHWQNDALALITLVGKTRQVLVPVAVFEEENRLTIIGRAEIHQSDFGITPFSALGGIMRVDDKVLIRFRIQANAE